jgi:hypothetical protein
MKLPLSKLNYTFSQKPLLVGGKAMEYYELRKSGADIDLIAPEQDVIALLKKYPERAKNLYSDLGVCPFEFEIWRTICLLRYEDLIEGAIEEKAFYVISLEKLLFMKALALDIEKYARDVRLIAEKIKSDRYRTYSKEKARVEALLSPLGDITYIEKIDG